jgi:hypothetical protein
MPKNRIIIILGACVALLPILGFPKAWESFFQVVAGLAIIGVSIWSTIDRKLSLKAKAQMRQSRKTVEPTDPPAPIMPPETPTHGKRVTDFYPKTGQPGRRMSDIKPTLLPGEEEETQ